MVLEEGALFADRYQLIKLLGRGGFSEVWLANDTKSGVDVALKVYAPYGGLDENGNRLFSQEFSLVFNINQTNLLKPTYFDSYERSPYLILPFCSRGSCLALVGKTDEKTLIDILHDVASGLSYLHSQDPPIIHQDIKPDNILINDHGDYLITDFGISTKVRSTLRKSAMTQENSSGGTYAYMGPERFSKQPTPVKASDIWSVGAMAYELVEGVPPFDNMGGVMQKNGAEIPEIQTEGISDTVKNIIYSCLAAEPWDRPTAEVLVEWTTKLKAGEPLKLGGKEKKGRINNLFKQTILRDGKAKAKNPPKPEPAAPAPASVSSMKEVAAAQPQGSSSHGKAHGNAKENPHGNSNGKSNGNSHGNSNGKTGLKKLKPAMLYGIIGGAVAILAIIIGVTVSQSRKKAAEIEKQNREKQRIELESRIYDDYAPENLDKTFPAKDPETGATLNSARSLTVQAYKMLRENEKSAAEAVKILERVSETGYKSSAEACALLGMLYSNKDMVRMVQQDGMDVEAVDENGNRQYYLDSLYRAYCQRFKANVRPDWRKAHELCEKAVKLDSTCFTAHYELALDYVMHNNTGRSGIERQIIKFIPHAFRGYKYAQENKNDTYTKLFSNLLVKFRSNIISDFNMAKDTRLKQSELSDVWTDIVEFVNNPNYEEE